MQDTKPHRQIPLSLIIDALEYQLPPNKGIPGATSPSAASPPIASASPDELDGAGAHTFKVVTTKRALLLCAPSEEEEIKWLSAIRALIARRSALPGDSLLAASPGAPPATPGAAAAATAGTNALGNSGPISRRRDSIVRRLSLSGGSAHGGGAGAFAPSSVGSGVGVSAPPTPATGVHPDAPSERQSH